MPIKVVLNMFFYNEDSMLKYKDRFFEFYLLSNDTSGIHTDEKDKSKKVVCSYFDFILLLLVAKDLGAMGKIVVIERIYKKSPNNNIISILDKENDFWNTVRTLYKVNATDIDDIVCTARNILYDLY